MIPNHILDDLSSDDRIAVLSHRGSLQFFVHRATDSVDVIRAKAVSDGAEVLATHLHDREAILALVADRERDLGGEG